MFSGPDHRAQTDIENRKKRGPGLGGAELKESDPSSAGQVETENGKRVDSVEKIFGEGRLGQAAIRTDLRRPDRVGFDSEVRHDKKFRLPAETDFSIGKSDPGGEKDPGGGPGNPGKSKEKQ